MVFLDLVNIVAGAYKGVMDASGQPVDPSTVLQVLAWTSGLSGASRTLDVIVDNHKYSSSEALNRMRRVFGDHRPTAVVEGVKRTAVAGAKGTAEIMISYGVAFLAYKTFT